MKIWNELKNFNIKENWGNYTRINGLLLVLLDKITNNAKAYTHKKYGMLSPCIIHCAYASSGHSPNSQHYLGNAADFSFRNLPPLEAYEIIIQTLQDFQAENHVGLGVYPDWENIGFHLDVRGRKARWSRINGLYCNIDAGLRKLTK